VSVIVLLYCSSHSAHMLLRAASCAASASVIVLLYRKFLRQ
jgi:hypothetical protein